MKKIVKRLFLSSIIILSLTGCDDYVDIILTETSSTEASIPNIIESVPEESMEISDIITTEALPPVTTAATTRPEDIQEYLDMYEFRGFDISFEPIEETELTIFAKKYVSEMVRAVNLIANTSWNTVIDLDEYMDDGYLKDYIEFDLKIQHRQINRTKSNFEFERLEAVEQKQVGDITYIAVRYFALFIDDKSDAWRSKCWTEWVGIRNGRIVNESVVAGPYVDRFIGIDPDMNDTGGYIYYYFQSDINPWDSMEDIEKIYKGLQSENYGIEMKEYPYPPN